MPINYGSNGDKHRLIIYIYVFDFFKFKVHEHYKVCICSEKICEILNLKSYVMLLLI